MKIRSFIFFYKNRIYSTFAYLSCEVLSNTVQKFSEFKQNKYTWTTQEHKNILMKSCLPTKFVRSENLGGECIYEFFDCQTKLCRKKRNERKETKLKRKEMK